MSFRDVSDVDPGVHVGNDLFVFFRVLVEYSVPFIGRSIEILQLFDRMDQRLNGAGSLEDKWRRIARGGTYSKELNGCISQ